MEGSHGSATAVKFEAGQCRLFQLAGSYSGTLPLLDNWEIVGGLLFGTLTSMAVLPYITFGKWDAYQKKILMAATVPVTVVLFSLVLYLVYEVQNASDNCSACRHFNCASYTDSNCDIERLV